MCKFHFKQFIYLNKKKLKLIFMLFHYSDLQLGPSGKSKTTFVILNDFKTNFFLLLLKQWCNLGQWVRLTIYILPLDKF